MKIGQRCRFFDDRPWRKNGGDHPEGNDRYFLPATVVNIRRDAWDRELADIRYDHEPERISRGHFTDVTLPCLTPQPSPSEER